MAMTPKILLTISGASIELGVDRRAVARAVVGVAPAGRVNGADAWPLRTILQHLDKSPGGVSVGGTGAEAQCVEIERCLGDFQAGRNRLHAESKIEARRKMLRDGLGETVGRLSSALEAGAESCLPHEQMLLKIVRDQIIGEAVRELLGLCGWTLDQSGSLVGLGDVDASA
jgi:hypothetical protein